MCSRVAEAAGPLSSTLVYNICASLCLSLCLLFLYLGAGDLQKQLDHCRLPLREYDFEVVREIVTPQGAAVLGSISVNGIVRQAWGTANASQFGDQVMTQVSLHD